MFVDFLWRKVKDCGKTPVFNTLAKGLGEAKNKDIKKVELSTQKRGFPQEVAGFPHFSVN